MTSFLQHFLFRNLRPLLIFQKIKNNHSKADPKHNVPPKLESALQAKLPASFTKFELNHNMNHQITHNLPQEKEI